MLSHAVAGSLDLDHDRMMQEPVEKCDLHAVIEDLDRQAADRLECVDVATKRRLEVLVEHVAREQEARVTEYQAEQQDDAAGAGVVGEVHHEAREADLYLDPGRRLEAQLIGLGPALRPDRV